MENVFASLPPPAYAGGSHVVAIAFRRDATAGLDRRLVELMQSANVMQNA